MNEATVQTFSVLEVFDWSEYREVGTKAGSRMVRTAQIPFGEEGQAFWTQWKENGGKFKAAGFSVGKYDNEWRITEWKMPDGGTTPQAARVKEVEEAQKRAENWVPEDVIIPESMKSLLLEYQPDSVKRIAYALNKHGRALDGSDMGTGKTFTAIATAIILGLKPAVICPLAVIPSWHRALKHFGYSANMIINYESLRTGNTPYGSWTKIGKSEVFEFNLPTDSLMVFDEVQKMKNPSSKNCKLGIGAIRQGFKILGCSGTIASNPMEMRFSGEVAKLHHGGDFYAWMHRNGVVKEQWGFSFRGGQAVLHKIRQQIYPEHGTRLRKDDLPGFPECDIQAEAYDCGKNTKQIERVYDHMLGKLAEIEADSSKSSSEKKASSLAEVTAARMEAETLKIPAIVDLANAYVEEGNSVVIFTNYRNSLAIIKDILKTECIVQGGQKPEEREAIINSFQEDKERIIIVNIQSGGAGISLHDIRGQFPRISIICPSWSCFDMSQATGRIHRAGAKSKAVQKVFFASGTIEESVCNKVREKLKNMAALNDADLTPKGVF